MLTHAEKQQPTEKKKSGRSPAQEQTSISQAQPTLSVLRLQRTIGNKAVHRLMGGFAIQRRVTVDATRQTVTPEAAVSMTDTELDQEVSICQQALTVAEGGSPESAVLESNLSVLEAERSSRAGERQQLRAGPSQELVDASQNKMALYSSALTSVKTNTANAGRRALLNFTNFSGIPEPAGIQVVDLFAVLIQALPFAGPIAKLITGDLVRSAAIAMLREASVRTATRIEGRVRGGSAEVTAEARAEFVASRASDFDEMERLMGDAITSAVDKYGQAIQAGRQNPSGLLDIYTELENLVKENQGLTRADFDTIADSLELRLYKEYYASRVHILVDESAIAVHSQTIVGMPSPIQARIARLVGGSSLEEVMHWGVPVETHSTSGKPF